MNGRSTLIRRERDKWVLLSRASRRPVREAKLIAASKGAEMQRAGAIRRIIPWETVQAALIERGYARFVG